MDHVQGLILSGDYDADPHLYGEELKPKIGAIWPARDYFDMLLLELAEELGKLVLGICRGAQIINVAHGGSFYQDVAYRKEEILKHDQQHMATSSVTRNAGKRRQSICSNSWQNKIFS